MINTYFTTMTLSTYLDAVAKALTPTVGTAKPAYKENSEHLFRWLETAEVNVAKMHTIAIVIVIVIINEVEWCHWHNTLPCRMYNLCGQKLSKNRKSDGSMPWLIVALQTVHFDWCVIPYTTSCSLQAYITTLLCCSMEYLQYGGVYYNCIHNDVAVTHVYCECL